MQAWQRTGFSAKWAHEVGLDSRGMRFARDVRRQLEAATGPVSARPSLGLRWLMCVKLTRLICRHTADQACTPLPAAHTGKLSLQIQLQSAVPVSALHEINAVFSSMRHS